MAESPSGSKVKMEDFVGQLRATRVTFFAAYGLLLLALPNLAPGQSEKTTKLPLHVGLTLQQEVDSPICGKAAHMILYDTPSGATLTDYIAWYKSQLAGFHYVHKTWQNRAQEMFYSPDGLKGVSITGEPNGPGVYAVAYFQGTSTLTTHQMDLFSPNNPSCK